MRDPLTQERPAIKRYTSDEGIATTRAVISRENLVHNIKIVQRFVTPGTDICLAVKANAYGHGALSVARIALGTGVTSLGISSLQEGENLRESGITAPIVLYSPLVPAALPRAVELDLALMVGARSYAREVATAARQVGKKALCHLAIDTGMRRTGCSPQESLALASAIDASPFLILHGVCTHFSVADGRHKDDVAFTSRQLRLFRQSLKAISRAGLTPKVVHAANSGATLAWPETHFTMVRPGICLYGYPPVPMPSEEELFLPVMQLESRVIFTKWVSRGSSVSYGRTWRAPRDTKIATIGIGYGDGYNRLLSSSGQVSIRDTLYPIVGTICMDQCMVDLGPESPVELYDRVVLFGSGRTVPSVTDIAKAIKTIPYEITCAISQRVPRIYRDRHETKPAS